MKQKRRLERASYIRNFIFGVEDSLVSTVGLLAGVSAGGIGQRTIILTGVVLIFVEAFSMGIGSFLSEETAQEYINRRGPPLSHTIGDAVIMFFSYFLAGFIPLSPYLVFLPGHAVVLSITFSLFALLLLGLLSGKIFRGNVVKSGIRMLVMGGLAILVGMLAGSLAKTT